MLFFYIILMPSLDDDITTIKYLLIKVKKVFLEFKNFFIIKKISHFYIRETLNVYS